MEYSPIVTLLLCAPLSVFGAVTSVPIMRPVPVFSHIHHAVYLAPFYSHPDATRNCFWYITGPVILSIIGFLIANSTMNVPIAVTHIRITSVR